jgi:hypothetical protein
MAKTLEVKNYKGLKHVALSPGDRSLIVIAGANGAGKSSFIDPLRELFRYKGVKETPHPIRDGEDSAFSEYVDTDLDIRFRRDWKRSASGKITSTFSAYALDGAKHDSATAILAQHLGGELIDPVEFVNLDEKKQREVLLSKVELPFDIDRLAAEKKGAEERRLLAGREVERLRGALASLPKATVPKGTEPTSATAILAEIADAESKNNARFRLMARRNEAETEIAKLEARLVELRNSVAEVRAQLAEAPPLIDTDAIRARLAAVEDTNAEILASKSWHETSDLFDAALSKYEAEQSELDRIVKVKAEGLAAANFPLADLSVDDDGVTFRGVPFVQLNSAQQVVVGFDIATSGNPDLKLIFIRSGDLLDDDTLALLAARGEERGYTIITERGRDNSEAIGYVIDDGELVNA